MFKFSTFDTMFKIIFLEVGFTVKLVRSLKEPTCVFCCTNAQYSKFAFSSYVRFDIKVIYNQI